MKRLKNEGTIFQRKDGRWVYSWTETNGRRRCRYARTAEEAQKNLRDLLSSKDRGEYVAPSAVTIEQWLNNWLNDYAALSVKPSTFTAYEGILRNHLIPALGKYKLQELRPETVQAFVNRKDKEGYSPSSVKRFCNVLRTAYGQAIANKLCFYNPCAALKMRHNEQKEIVSLSADELRALLPLLPDSTNGRALRFILGTGLRVSELCGLRWADVGADGFEVKQITYVTRKQRIVDTPKTKAGKRYIPLNGKLKAILDEQLRVQRLECMRAGSVWAGEKPGKGYVFATANGLPNDRANLARCLRNCLKLAGLPTRGVHTLRHTFATNWVQSGADLRTLSEILGHTNVAFTMQRYVHSDNATKISGMEKMAALI